MSIGLLLRFVRRGSLLAVIGGAIAYLCIEGIPIVCSETLTPGESLVSRRCEPMAVTDLRALLFLIVLVLLLLPDLSELEIGGVVAVRRQVRRAQDEADELRTDVARLRNEVLTVSAAAAQSRSAASVRTVNVFPERGEDVARAYLEVDGEGDGEFDAWEERGAVAAMAFEAGFFGLTRLLPASLDPAVVAGYITDESGDLVLRQVASTRDDPDDVQRVQRSADLPTDSAAHERSSRGQLFSAPAFNDAGDALGVLAVESRTDRDLTSVEYDEAAAIVVVMADVYAALLTTLLDHRPRASSTGPEVQEGGQ